MQFQELENPIQISPHCSCTPSGFFTEMMSMKPAKGRTPFTGALRSCSCNWTEEIWGHWLEMTVTDVCQRWWLSQTQKTGVGVWVGVIFIGF